MKRSSSSRAKRSIQGRAGQFRVKGIMDRKYVEGHRPETGRSNKNKPFWNPVAQ